jgi:hypothetical protein
LEKEKKDLEKKINGILQENRNLDGLIEKAHKDINHWQDKVSDAQNEMNYINASSSGDAALWADDPYDPRYLELQQNQFRKMLTIKSDFDNAQKEITQAKNKISSLKSNIIENKSKINSLQSELKSIDDKLRKTPSQRAEEHYQQLLEEKKSIFSQSNSFNVVIDKLTELVKQFVEMEGYKDTVTLKKECFDLAVKKHYDYLVQLKNDFDSSKMATPEDYRSLAEFFREEKGYADTEELARDCENMAIEVQYNQLIKKKNNASTEKEYQDLAKLFRAMNGYKNTTELANECENQPKAEYLLRDEQERKHREEQIKHRERIAKYKHRILAESCRTFVLNADGTVIAIGDNKCGQCDVAEWREIVAIATSYLHTVGLKANGTVVAVGDNKYGQCDVAEWREIVAIASSIKHTVGLKENGTVVAVGDNEYGQCDVTDWRDIVAISTSSGHTVGLKADGTVVAVGSNDEGECDVSREEFEKKQEENKLRQVEEEEQSIRWQDQGLCAYCGGQLGGLFTKRCQSCGKEQYYMGI